jgi:hypothetical protein
MVPLPNFATQCAAVSTMPRLISDAEQLIVSPFGMKENNLPAAR